MKIKKFLCLFCFLLCSCASTTSTQTVNSPILNLTSFKMPSGIYYDGHIYWEIDDGKKERVQGESLGTLQAVAQENSFPISNLVGTKDLKKCIGSKIYAENNHLYLEYKGEVVSFQYITKSKEKREEIVSADKYQDSEYAVPPHFIFKEMLYATCQSEDIELPSNFRKVGKIEKSYVLANTNFTGNIPVDSIVYATDYQNRFMIEKNSENHKYYIFENDAYKDSEK